MLHKTSKMQGFHIHATDGEIGHVEEFLVDENSWSVKYLVVDTGNWIGGRSVLISAAVVERIDSPNEEIRVKLSRQQIEASPSVETAEIELVETLPSVWIL
jgi:hypothetical protein